MKAEIAKSERQDNVEKPETYSFTSKPSLIQKIQELSNKIHNGNRSKTIVALLEKEFQG